MCQPYLHILRVIKRYFAHVCVWVVLFVNVTFQGKITISYTFIIYSVEFNGLN